MEHAITVKDLHVSYYGMEAVRDVTFSAKTNSIVGVIGPNGAGKSTLLKSLLNLVPKDKGEVKIAGKPVDKMRRQIAYVPQRNQIDWDFPITVLDTVVIGTYPKLGLFKRPKKNDREWAYECLTKVGMEDFSERQIGELSGGQQQRVFVARALAQKPDLFFLDEPFVGIDVSSEETIINILREQRDQGKTIFIVHHDLSKASAYFDELLLMNKELIKYGAVKDVCRAEVITKAYQGQLSFLKEVGMTIS